MSITSEARNAVATAAIAFVATVTAATGQGTSTLPAAMPVGSPAEATALRARGQLLGYNLDRDGALASFREAMVLDPTDPAAHRLTAATLWINALFEQGAVTAEDYLGQARSDSHRHPAAAALETVFRDHLDRALKLAEERCRSTDNADAHFQLGAAYGYQATYAATIEGSLYGTL